MRFRYHSAGCLVSLRPTLAGLIAVLAWGAVDGRALAEDWQAMEGQLVAIVRARFYDRARADDWAKANARYARDVRDRAGYDQAAREAIARLGVSHTAYYTEDEPRYHGLRSIFRPVLGLSPKDVEVDSIGIDAAPGGFVRVVFAGSPAEKSGLKRGDRIVLADDKPFGPIASFRGRAGQAVRLSVQGRRDGPVREVLVVPRRIDPRQEWLEDQEKGARVVERGGKKVAVMRLFSAAGREHEDLVRDAIAGPFAAADALVLDLRDGWGGAMPSFVNLFNRTPPELEQIGRDGKKSRFETQWRKPLVVVLNEGSKSGKEVVAFAIKKHRIGKLVGSRSGGAVLAGKPIPLATGGTRAILYLAVGDVLVDGERLEGRGVEPDIRVQDLAEFAEGSDPQLDRAIDVASGR